MGLDLQTITESGSVPKSVIKDSYSARQIFDSLLQDDMPSNQMRARLEGMLDGNVPFDDAELEQLGQAGRTNCNWGTAKARVDQAKQPLYDILTSVSTYASIRTDYGGPVLATTFSRIFSEEFHRLMDEWDEFLERMEVHHDQLVPHGLGAMFWRDNVDWRFNALLRREILIPSNAKSSRNQQELIYIRDSMSASELWSYVKDPEIARSTKWNVEMCKEAIRQSAVTEEDRTRDWEWWQAQFKDNNYFISFAKTRQIHIIHVLAKEFDGKVSHHIMTRQPIGGPDRKDDYIFSEIGRFDEINQVVWLSFDNVGNRDFKSVRGLGNALFHFGEASNRLNNAIIDGAIRGTCNMWQAETAADAQKFLAIEIGPDRLLPPGFKAVPLNTGANISEAMETASYFRMMEGSNTSSYRGSLDTKDGNPITAREATLQAGEKASLTSSKSEHYARDLDRLYRETFRRASNRKLLDSDPGAKEAKAFQKRCKDRGIPDEAWDHIVSVRATRSIGNGSATGRILQLQQMIPIVLTRSPEASQKNFVNDLIGAMAGNQGAVEAYGIPMDDPAPGEEEWEATIENNAFLSGGHVLITPQQNNFTHATYHINFMAGIISDVQQGGIDPITASMALDDAGPHTLQHMKAMEGDATRRRELGKLKEQFGQITRQADEIRQAAKQMEAEQAKAQPKPMNVSERLNVNYADAPPDIQRQIEALLGLTPSTQKSVKEETLDLKKDTLVLKDRKQNVDITKTRQSMVLDDVKTADQIANSHVDRKVKQKPKPSTNGSKK